MRTTMGTIVVWMVFMSIVMMVWIWVVVWSCVGTMGIVLIVGNSMNMLLRLCSCGVPMKV